MTYARHLSCRAEHSEGRSTSENVSRRTGRTVPITHSRVREGERRNKRRRNGERDGEKESEEERRRQRAPRAAAPGGRGSTTEVKRTDGRTDGRANERTPGERVARTSSRASRYNTATSYNSSHGRSRVATSTGHLRLSAVYSGWWHLRTPRVRARLSLSLSFSPCSLSPSSVSLSRRGPSVCVALVPAPLSPSFILSFSLPLARSFASAFSPALSRRLFPRRPSRSFSHG